MKKILGLVLGLGLIYGSTFASHSSDCADLSFNDADLCISIDQQSSNRFEVNADVSNQHGTVSLLCDVLLPNNNLVNVGACNGEFTYNGQDERTIKLYVRVNQEYKTLEGTYDFDNGEWTDFNSSSHNNHNNNNGDLDNFSVTADDTTPSTSQRVDLTVKARDDSNDVITDYDGTIDYKVYYRSSSSSSWTQTTSSTYYEVDSDYDNGYEFTSSDDGVADLSNFIKFKKNNYDYKVRIYDQDDTSVYKEITFNVGSSSNNNNNNGDLDNFSVTADDTTPSTSQWVDLTVKARDDSNDVITDYDGTIDYKVYYRSSSSSSWTQTTSSSYYEVDSDYDNGYEFTSSDDGVADLSNFIKFKKNNYDYKVRIYDQDDTSVYKEITFNVGSSSNNNNNNGDLDDFDITLSPSTPASDEWTDVTIEAVDNNGDRVNGYDGTVSIVLQYKDGSTWRDLSFGSYDIRNISIDSNDEYDFDSYDNGRVTFEVKFDDEDDYRIVVEDNDENVTTYKTFTVDDNGSSSSSNDGDFSIKISPTTPEEDEDIDVTIKALDSNGNIDDNYNDMIRFVVQKRSGSSWVNANSSDYDLNRTSYTFNSSDDGEVVLSNLINFSRQGTYRLKVYQSNNTSIVGYKEIEVDNNGSSSSSNDGFTNSERSQIRAIYNLWPSLISQLENKTPSLRYNNSWQNDQEDLYTEMRKIKDDDDSIYGDYNEFFDAFMERYSHTLTLTH